MWEGERRLAKGAESAAHAPATAAQLRVAGGHAVARAAAVRADTVALAPGLSARRAFEQVLITYSAAIAENLRCVLSETDPEGAHQLRVTLRRLRTCLRVFKPVVRREPANRIRWVARYIGAIVGELRDADVLIEDMIRPTLQADAAMPAGVDAWRENIRAKVRMSLQSARAMRFANDLILLTETGGWRAKTARKQSIAATDLINAALDIVGARAAARAGRMLLLTAQERHDLRKDLKTLRYTAELSAAHDERAAAMAAALKRLQSVLGELNDVHMLETFADRGGVEPLALTGFRQRMSEEYRKRTPALIDTANKRWLEFIASGHATHMVA